MGKEKKIGATLAVAKAKGKLILIGVLIAIILITLGFMWFQNTRVKNLSEENKKLLEEISQLQDQIITLTKVNSEVVLDTIRAEFGEISELATAEYSYTNAARYENKKNFWGIKGLTKKTFTMKWDGVIKAGIDLSDFETDFDKANNVLTLRLPKAKILSHAPDFDSAEVLDEKDGLFNPVSVDDHNQFLAACGKEMEKKATDSGLLAKAEENAEAVLTKLLFSNPEIKKCTLKFEFK